VWQFVNALKTSIINGLVLHPNKVLQPSGRLRSFGCGSDHMNREFNKVYFSVEEKLVLRPY